MKVKIFSFLSEIATACKIWSKKFQPYLITKTQFFCFGIIFLKKLNNKALFSLIIKFRNATSRKNFGGIDVFSCNNVTSENNKSTVYC